MTVFEACMIFIVLIKRSTLNCDTRILILLNTHARKHTRKIEELAFISLAEFATNPTYPAADPGFWPGGAAEV